MKQTISIFYPPPPPKNRQETTTLAKNTTKIEWVSTGLSSLVADPTPFLSLSFFLFAMQHLKHLNGLSLAGRCLPDIVCCWDRVCPCLVPPSRSFALIRFLWFCKILVRRMLIITIKHLMRCCYYRLIMRGSRNFVRGSPTKI